jgi:hypothetical protein
MLKFIPAQGGSGCTRRASVVFRSRPHHDFTGLVPLVPVHRQSGSAAMENAIRQSDELAARAPVTIKVQRPSRAVIRANFFSLRSQRCGIRHGLKVHKADLLRPIPVFIKKVIRFSENDQG